MLLNFQLFSIYYIEVQFTRPFKYFFCSIHTFCLPVFSGFLVHRRTGAHVKVIPRLDVSYSNDSKLGHCLSAIVRGIKQ